MANKTKGTKATASGTIVPLFCKANASIFLWVHYRTWDWLLIALFACIFFLQMLDLDSTLQAMIRGRVEQNLFIDYLGGTIGIVSAVATSKLVASLLIGVYFILIRSSTRRYLVAIPMLLLVLVYGCVVANNYS